MSLSALCPGTFDPVTNGHLDIIGRAAALFDHVVVAVIENPSKEPLFSIEDRRQMLKEGVADLGNVEVDSFAGLLVDYAKDKQVAAIIKGIRAISDFDYELQMAQMNRQLSGVETCFIPTSPQWSYLSSSLVKEIGRLGGDISGLVPAHVLERLREALA